jgi:hypothetical protein
MRSQRSQRRANTVPREAHGWCHVGQSCLPITVTNHIDSFAASPDDGSTWLREDPTSGSDRHLISDRQTRVVGIEVRRRNGNDVSDKRIRLVAIIGASVVVAVGSIAVGINQDRSLGTDASPSMSTGTTITESAAPTALSVTEATPAIRGPAPLPSEEQGLPG